MYLDLNSIIIDSIIIEKVGTVHFTYNSSVRYSHASICVTTPVPIVLWLSRSVNRCPLSIGISGFRVITSAVSSPGMTISLPSGSSMVAETLAVRVNICGW